MGSQLPQVRALVVDDDPDIRNVLRCTLEVAARFEVRTAEGIAEARAVVREWCPDIVLLDVMMPGISGVDGLPLLRGEPGMANVPVVFVTAHCSSAEEGVYRRCGAAGVIGKPFDPFQLSGQVLGMACGAA